MEEPSAPYEFDPVEDTWGWDAPRKRIAKLLWLALQLDSSEATFMQRFTYYRVQAEVGRSQEVLQPIQARLRRILEAFQSRREQDQSFGQGSWGEDWWLPVEDADFVRTQLGHARIELLDRSSDYEEMFRGAMARNVKRMGVLPIPSDDPARVYVGVDLPPAGTPGVTVHTTDKIYPLRQLDRFCVWPDGVDFTWGYGGSGPAQLARCILCDATGGDLEFVEKMWGAFAEDIIIPWPQFENLRISWTEMMAWIDGRGASAFLNDRKQAVREKLAKYGSVIEQAEQRIRAFEAMGGLRAQRFDIVPKDFECALYVDFMRMLEQSGFTLRCARCRLPISVPHGAEGRSNRQRARWEKGQPVYHAECFGEHRKERKADYWNRKSQSEDFRASQRQRAKEYRKK